MNKRALFILAMALLLVQGLLRVAAVPLWANYDEASHFEYVRYLMENRRFPTEKSTDPTIVRSIAATYGPDTTIGKCNILEVRPCFYSGEQNDEMPLYYVAQAIVQLPFTNATLQAQVIVGRIVSLTLLVVTVWLGYRTAELLFPADPLVPVGVAFGMALLFPFVDSMTGINNDAAANASMSLFVYAWVRLTTRATKRWRDWALVAAAIIVAVLSKATAWLVIPLLGAAAVLYFIPWNRTLVLIAVGVAIVTLPVLFVWSPQGGPIVRPAINNIVAGVIPINPNAQIIPFYQPGSPAYYWRVTRWIFTSFWGSYATGRAALPWGAVLFFAIATLVATLGWAYRLIATRRLPFRIEHLLFLSLAIVAAFAANVLRASPFGAWLDYIPTARHMNVAVVPIMIMFVGGLRMWFAEDTPRAWRYTLAMLLLVMYGIGVWSLLNVQIPAYVAWSFR